jgi:recombination protein RecR
MKYPSKILENAVKSISTLPGIGKKTALRLALHLIHDKTDKASMIAKSLIDLDEQIMECKICFSLSDNEICDICKSPARNISTLCLVENVRDMMAIEDTASYHGRYHILGGLISPLDGIGPNDINIESLLKRINDEHVNEVIIAISPTIEGETTSFYISKKLAEFNVKISTIARGVSFGGELEYADEVTLSRSISGRIPFKMDNL